MSLRNLVLLPVVGLLIAACSAGGSVGATPSTSPASPTPASPTPSASLATRIEVKLSDALRMEPTAIAVSAGVAVTFVVTNTGSIDHEFYLGDERAQAEHDKDMQSMGGMMHHEPEGIALKAGQTKELTYTFAQAGQTLAGCHVTGHYAGGMKATITVKG